MRYIHPLRRGVPEGRRVVFAHGVEDRWSNWQGLADRLPDDWRIDALAMPWESGNDYSWRHGGTVGGWLRAALAELDGPVDALVGHSLGGNAVLELLCDGDRPAPVAAVMCPVYLSSAEKLTWEFLGTALTGLQWEFTELVRIQLRQRRRPPPESVVERTARKALERISPVSFLAVSDQFLRTGDFALESIGIPVMVMSVGNDPGLTPQDAKLLVDRIGRAEAYHFEGFDHFCHVHEPEAVAAALRDYLRATW